MNNIAEILLKTKAVFFNTENPFKWSSGFISPIYTDNRVIISYPKERKVVEKKLAKLILRNFKNVDAIVGTATAGIPHAAYISQMLNLPLAYVRAKAKEHGRTKLIEGNITNAKNVVVIEDLLSTGSSCLEVVKILREQKINVLSVVSIFNYQLKECHDNFIANDCQYISLCTLDELLEHAVQTNYISTTQRDLIIKFREDPHKYK